MVAFLGVCSIDGLIFFGNYYGRHHFCFQKHDRKCGQKNTSVCFNCTAMSSFNRKGQNRLNLSYLRNNKMLFAILLVVFFNFYQATSLLDG